MSDPADLGPHYINPEFIDPETREALADAGLYDDNGAVEQFRHMRLMTDAPFGYFTGATSAASRGT